MFNVRLQCAAFSLGLMGFAPLAVAQDKLDHRSLEFLISQTPTVVVGTATRVSDGAVTGGATTFTVEVVEVIKGARIERVTLPYWNVANSPTLAELIRSRRQCLWFIEPSGTQTPGWKCLPLDPFALPGPKGSPLRSGDQLAFDAGYGHPVFSMDLSVLTTKAAILNHARAFARKHPESVGTYGIKIPAAVAERSGWTFAINTLDVPMTDELQDTARRLIKDPGFALPAKWEMPTFFFDIPFGRTKETLEAVLREQGIRALAGFKSHENIALLKPYLADPGVVVAAWSEYPARRYFIVRLAAYEVLKGWGVDVPKPETEPVPPVR